jgi:LETM1-like protein
MKIEEIIEEHAHHFLVGIKAECNGDKEAVLIIRKYIKEGKITEEEDHLIKTQLMDTLKIVGIGVPFVLIPGASILMPILIKVAHKENIDLMPSAFH